MIIECEKCHTRFRLDEGLLKETGSKVRCSVCKYKFIQFPPKPEPKHEEAVEKKLEEPEVRAPEEAPKEERLTPDMDKTLIGEVIEEAEFKVPEEASKEVSRPADIDKTIEGEVVEGIGTEEEEIEPISFEDLSLIDSGVIRQEQVESIDIDEALDRAKKLEEELIAQKELERDETERIGRPAEPHPVIKKKGISKLSITILLIILILVGTAAALVFFRPDLIPESFPLLKKPLSKEEAFDMGNKRLSFKDLKGSFVNSKKTGKLFLVNGSVTNNYPDTRNFIRLKSNILDSKGTVVKSKIIYAGNQIDDKELQSLSIEEINNRLLNRSGENKMNMNIRPGSSIPFMIIFSKLPDDISEFTVEAISSSPAKK